MNPKIAFLKKHWAKLVLALAAVIVIGTLVSAISGLVAYGVYSKNLPDVAQLKNYRPSVVSRLLARDGRLITEFYVEKRIPVSVEEVPPFLLQAVVAVEDAEFFRHHGVNPMAILRSLLADLKAGRFVQGGSTITQQVARTMFLTPEKKIPRKIKEMILAYRIDRAFTKQEILELYLNHIYFGSGAYGIEAAANMYFGKSARDINLLEAAVLAGLPRAPNFYSPNRHKENSLRRAKHVLQRMTEEGFLTDQEEEDALALNLDTDKGESAINLAPYFAEYVRLDVQREYGSTTVYREGLTIDTTLDLGLQQQARLALRQGLRVVDKRRGFRGPIDHVDTALYEGNPAERTKFLETFRDPAEADLGLAAESRTVGFVESVFDSSARLETLLGPVVIPWERMAWVTKANQPIQASGPKEVLIPGDVVWVKLTKKRDSDGLLIGSLDQEPDIQGALVCLDCASGEVLAMVGGYDFQVSRFDRSVQAQRQPGSAFKMFTYLTALEKGYSPDDVIVDAPIVYPIEVTNPESPDRERWRIWKPSNFEREFYGLNSLKEALAHSRNASAVRLIGELGIGEVIKTARRLGIKSSLRPELSLTLGTSEVNLLEITSAAAVIANEGIITPVRFIRRVMDRSGQVLEQIPPDPRRVVDKDIAVEMKDMMEEVVRNGTGQQALVLKRPVGGKTGTTDFYTDAWFIGFSIPFATGVWVGMDDHSPIGNRETGARAALPIWIDFMKFALQEQPIPVPPEEKNLPGSGPEPEPTPTPTPLRWDEFYRRSLPTSRPLGLGGEESQHGVF